MAPYNPGPPMLILANQMNSYLELKSQVEAKWDIIAMLCLLVFFLAVVAVTYARLFDRIVTFLR